MPRFPLLTDENVDGPFVSALAMAGWHVFRAVDVVGERSTDEGLLALAAERGRVLATTDRDHLVLASEWSTSRGSLRVVFWRNTLQQRLRPGAWVEAFEALAREADPFARSVVAFLKLPEGRPDRTSD